MGNRNFIDNQSLEFINAILDESSTVTIQDAKFGWSDNGRAFIWFKYLNSSNETKYRKYEFAGTRGTIIRLDSDDNTNWSEYSGHASASVFGAVKLSNDPTATGTSSDGLAPSQKAVSDVYTYAQGDQPKASASAFGKVKLSDNPNSTGAAQYGLAPSQAALLATTVLNTVTGSFTSSVSNTGGAVRRTGSVIEGYLTFRVAAGQSGEKTVMNGLPGLGTGTSQRIFDIISTSRVNVGSEDTNDARFWIENYTSSGSTKGRIKMLLPSTSVQEDYTIHFIYVTPDNVAAL